MRHIARVVFLAVFAVGVLVITVAGLLTAPVVIDRVGQALIKLRMPPDFVVHEGAIGVTSKANAESERVGYNVQASYPAEPVIRHISEVLAGRGWRPLHQNWLNRNKTGSYVRGWKHGLTGDQQYTMFWWSHWTNDRGDILEYMLTYMSPAAERTNATNLYVSGMKMNAAQAAAYAMKLGIKGEITEVPAGVQPNMATETEVKP